MRLDHHRGTETQRVPGNGSSRLENGARPTVCHVVHSLSIGGAELLAARLGQELAEFRTVFVCLDSAGVLSEQLRDLGFSISVIGRRAGWDLGCVRKLSRFFRVENVQLVHAHQYTPFFYCLATGLVGRRPPVLFTEHGRHFPDFPRRKRILFNRLFLRRSDRVVSVGQTVKRALVENEGIPSERVQVIYNGVDLDRFGPSECVRATVRDELCLGPSEFVIIQVARLDPLKDHLTAIRMMAKLKAKRDDVRLLLVGGGPERAAIESEIGRLGLARSIQLLGMRDDVDRLLCAADVALLTSVSEGIPLTLIEAMATGLPVVATDVGGVSEVVLPGKTGLLAAAKDDSGLADAVAGTGCRRRLAPTDGSRHGSPRSRALFKSRNAAGLPSPVRSDDQRLKMPARRKSLVVFADDWGRHPSSCQHLVRRLCREYRVLWVNTIGTRKLRMNSFTARRVVEKLRNWRKGLQQVGDQMWVTDLPMLPTFGNPLAGELNRRFVTRRLKSTLKQLEMTDVVVLTTLPYVLWMVHGISRRAIVYYVTDDFSHWPGADRDALLAPTRRFHGRHS